MALLDAKVEFTGNPNGLVQLEMRIVIVGRCVGRLIPGTLVGKAVLPVSGISRVHVARRVIVSASFATGTAVSA
jgi:hypothetical protein